MTISDPELREHVKRVVALMTKLPEETRPVCGLLDGYDWFYRAEGASSPQVREALQLLLSQELRPALRRWYQICGDEINPGALELRQRLGGLAGERLG